MGNVVQFNKATGAERLPDEAKSVLGKYRLEAMIKAEEMHRNPKAYSREDRKRLIRELEFARTVHENGWSDEEAEANREKFNKEKDAEDCRSGERFRKQWDMIYNEGKNLTEFERRQTEKHMEAHPEDAEIITGMVNMIEAGVNDPEHVTDYAD